MICATMWLTLKSSLLSERRGKTMKTEKSVVPRGQGLGEDLLQMDTRKLLWVN